MRTEEPPAAAAPTRGGMWATVDPLADCRAALHRKAFRLTHALAGHPLFAVDALIGVAQEAARRKGDIYMDAGDVAVTDKWGNIPEPQVPAAEILRRVETAGAWIVLKHVEQDPRYRAVLDDWVAFARELAGPEAAKLFRLPEMIVLITSPNRVTPFHFDLEINFLAQLHGTKDVWVCDPADRAIVTEADIERYYAVTITAGTYKPAAEERAAKFTLAPGEAVHIPTHGAHWVKNHDNVSVSVSFNFEFPNWYLADVYRANYYLRRLGLSPRPPGGRVAVDRAKAAAGNLLGRAKRTAGAVYRSARRLARR